MTEPRFQLLLVGDESVRESWGERLAAAGFGVDFVTSGRRAFHQLEADPVDLVVLAAALPDMSGLAWLRNIRRRYSFAALPVIVVAAGAQSDVVVEAFDGGANDVVSAPIDFPVLLARIQARLRGRRPIDAPAPGAEDDSWDDPEPGTILDGKYEIGARLGGGHFGRVYRARHLKLKRTVAVKVLHPRNQDRQEILERFRREGISACKVDHPNAVAVLDYSVTESGLPFLVMELLEGHSLNVEIRGGPLTPLRCAVILVPVCQVLAEAHSLGIIHRDVKPHNIFLHETRRGEVVKVLDFGIAKLMGDMLQDQELTAEGSGPGTPAYMAPERFSEEPCDGRADVYSLGVMLYEMLTGKPPFHTPNGNPIKLALMHMSQEPPPLWPAVPDLPRPIEKVVMRALEKDPSRRPTAAELARDFVTALGLELPATYGKSQV